MSTALVFGANGYEWLITQHTPSSSSSSSSSSSIHIILLTDIKQRISGIALLRELSSTPPTEWKKIIAISRRPPLLSHKDPRIKFTSIDLLSDIHGFIAQLEEAGGDEATHVFFYAYVEKEDPEEQIEVNRTLLANVS